MCPSDAAQFGSPQGVEDVHTPAFESFEHAALGDLLYVKYPTKDKTKTRDARGDVFHYQVGGETLSIGEIICLAGDFYGNWSFPEEAEQISDRWYSDPAASVRRFEANAATLAKDSPGHLPAIKAAMVVEWDVIRKCLKEGRDPAKEYHDNSDHFRRVYAGATGKIYIDSAFIHTARCNWDHFGKDAINAYKAGHTAALAKAREAHKTKVYDDLRYAYFLDAFALHFLTDLFSSGHLRTPRRILHTKLTPEGILGSVTGPQDMESICPGDFCSQKMHDEDCENGLFVTNALGDSWAMYGDGHLFGAKGSGNFTRVLQASQISLNEVYEVFKTGDDKAAGLFEPLKWIADLDKLDHPRQFAPLFKYDESTKTLYRRTHIDQRANPSFTVIQQTRSSFYENLKEINASESRRNRTPLARDLPKTAPAIQLQKTGNTYTVNQYGPITSSDHNYPKPTISTTWDMVGKSVSDFQSDGLEWASSKYLSEDVVLSVMRKENGGAEYGGYKVDFSDGASSPIQRLWKQGGPLKNNAGAAVLGKLSTNSQTTAFAPSAASNLYVFNSGITEEPTGHDALNIAGNGLTIREAITLNEPGLPSQLLARASVTNNSVRWSLHGWTEDYKEQLLFESNEASGPIAGEQWWRYLTGSLVGGNSTTQIVRILYGEHAEKDSLRVDVLKVAGNPPEVTQVSTRKYNVSLWGSPSENKYVKWLLLDVSQDGNPDIVGLINTDESTLATVVFPSRGDYTFGDPVVSRIYIPNTNFNPSHFKSISVKPVEFELTHLTKVTSQNTGILQFFDNYQILGARLLGPIAPGSLYYELKGQIPSIAGQISTGAGPDGDGLQLEDRPGFLAKPI